MDTQDLWPVKGASGDGRTLSEWQRDCDMSLRELAAKLDKQADAINNLANACIQMAAALVDPDDVDDSGPFVPPTL